MPSNELLAIIGMHRSGTSLVAGMLREIGWDVGPERDLMPPKPDNPRGFVEHLPAVRINDRLLYRLGGSWKEPPAMAPGWEHDRSLDDLRQEAADIARSLAARGPRVLFKDPRLSLTLPFWQTVAQVDRAVLVLRPPRPVVRSLLKRNDGLDADSAASLFTRYLLTSLRLDVHLHVVAPQAVLSDPDRELTELGTALGHTPTTDELAAARAHVEEDLWGRGSRLGTDEPLAGAAIEVAEELHGLVAGADGERWRRVLGRLTTVEELSAAERDHHAREAKVLAEAEELRERTAGLRGTLEETRARFLRVREERERARELQGRMREERDRALRRIGHLEGQPVDQAATVDGPPGDQTPSDER